MYQQFRLAIGRQGANRTTVMTTGGRQASGADHRGSMTTRRRDMQLFSNFGMAITTPYLTVAEGNRLLMRVGETHILYLCTIDTKLRDLRLILRNTSTQQNKLNHGPCHSNSGWVFIIHLFPIVYDHSSKSNKKSYSNSTAKDN
jgi:hypothetical protein